MRRGRPRGDWVVVDFQREVHVDDRDARTCVTFEGGSGVDGGVGLGALLISCDLCVVCAKYYQRFVMRTC